MTFLTKLKTALGLIEYEDKYTIQKDPKTGKWTIYDYDGHGITGYRRRYDAFRGAKRAGYTII